MRNLVFKLGRKRGHRHRKHRDDKTFALTDAGVRLLALKDYDAVSMAKIAREAGTSVGALYARFPEKNVYLYHLLADAFRSMRENAKLVLDGRRWPRESAAFVAKQIVAHVVAKMTTPRAAGVIRATIKLATVKPVTIELFEEYRTEITDLSIALLSPKLRAASPRAIRVAMQIILAAITDAVLQKRAGPMSAGSARMTEVLTNVLLGYLGLSTGHSWAGGEAEGEDEPDESITFVLEDEIEPDDASNRVYDPDLRAYRGRIENPTKPKRTRGRADTPPKIKPSASRQTIRDGRSETKLPPKAEVVTPPRVPKPSSDEPPKEVRRTRRVFI